MARILLVEDNEIFLKIIRLIKKVLLRFMKKLLVTKLRILPGYFSIYCMKHLQIVLEMTMLAHRNVQQQQVTVY